MGMRQGEERRSNRSLFAACLFGSALASTEGKVWRTFLWTQLLEIQSVSKC